MVQQAMRHVVGGTLADGEQEVFGADPPMTGIDSEPERVLQYLLAATGERPVASAGNAEIGGDTLNCVDADSNR